jgi:hypothetical protein
MNGDMAAKGAGQRQLYRVGPVIVRPALREERALPPDAAPRRPQRPHLPVR